MLRKTAFLAIFLASFGRAALAGNTTPGAAQMLVPDGSQYTEDLGTGTVHWFSTVLEGGHSYAVEVYNTSDPLAKNTTGVDLWEANGTTPFLVESGGVNTGSCTINASASPSLEATAAGISGPGTDGTRCLIYPLLDNSARNRVVRIRIYDPESLGATAAACQNCTARIRVRETTIVSRWSVNGYNMFVAVHNESDVPARGAVVYYADTPAGPASTVAVDSISLTGLGSVQFVHDSLSLNPNHGSVHVLVYGTGAFGAVELDVQTYAFSTTANNFNVFVAHRPNHGGPASVAFNQ